MEKPNYNLTFTQEAMRLANRAAVLGLCLSYQGLRLTNNPWELSRKGYRVVSLASTNEVTVYLMGYEQGQKP